jgi:hypothetical protein
MISMVLFFLKNILSWMMLTDMTNDIPVKNMSIRSKCSEQVSADMWTSVC